VVVDVVANIEHRNPGRRRKSLGCYRLTRVSSSFNFDPPVVVGALRIDVVCTSAGDYARGPIASRGMRGILLTLLHDMHLQFSRRHESILFLLWKHMAATGRRRSGMGLGLVVWSRYGVSRGKYDSLRTNERQSKRRRRVVSSPNLRAFSRKEGLTYSIRPFSRLRRPADHPRGLCKQSKLQKQRRTFS
jgi:hypothetical protein